MPLVLDSVLRARTLESVVASIEHGGHYLWPDAAFRVHDVHIAALTEAGLVEDARTHIPVHGENTALRNRTRMRRVDGGVEVMVSLVAHGTRLGDVGLARAGAGAWINRQERGHVRAYAETCSSALYSCMAVAELRRLALTDALTGLPNRRALDRELDRIDGDDRRCGLLFVDVDGLRSANNTLGYDAGNLLIVALAHALREAVGESDFAARLGGDEFVVVLSDAARAEAVAEQIEAAFAAQALPHEVATCCRGASIGATVRRTDESARDLVRRGAALMRSMKETRRTAHETGAERRSWRE